VANRGGWTGPSGDRAAGQAGLASGSWGVECPVGRTRLCRVLLRIAPEKEMAEETGLEPASPKAAVFKIVQLHSSSICIVKNALG
jgi:hypothetical protein